MILQRPVFLCVTAALIAVASARAERVPLDPDGLNKESTDIVTGKVVGVYSRDVPSDLYGKGTITTALIIEIEIAGIEKGDRLKRGELVYARCWRLKKRGDAGNRPGPSGHFNIPQEGDEVRAFLAYGKYGPTGQDDKGYAVVYPNGIEKVEKTKK